MKPVKLVISFSGVDGEILSSQDIVNKTRIQPATVNKLLSKLVKKGFLI